MVVVTVIRASDLYRGSHSTTRCTVVSCIYAPRFATLTLVENIRGAYMQDLTFYLANMPPLPVPCLDVDIGTLYYRPIEAADLPSLLSQKLDGQD